MKKLVTLLIVFLFSLEHGFPQDIDIGAGINYGGPIPVETVDSTSGQPLIGAMAGLSFTIPMGERFSFVPGLYYSFHGLNYSQSFTRDTLFTVIINGTSGEVPSFYTAYVNGRMRLHYIDIPLLAGYRIWKFQLLFGPYFSFLLGGKDAGDVRVVIGSGGFYDDYTEEYDNYKALRKMEVGGMVGSKTPIYRKLSIEMKVSRSLMTLYDLDKLPDLGQGIVKMYNTYFQVGLVYKIAEPPE